MAEGGVPKEESMFCVIDSSLLPLVFHKMVLAFHRVIEQVPCGPEILFGDLNADA